MVNLTQPAVLCFQNHIPEDKTSRKYYLEIEADLQAYKEAFADEALFAVLTKKLGDLLQLVRAQCSINPLHAIFFRENINIYLHFMSFLHTNKTQVVEIPPRVRQGPAYST